MSNRVSRILGSVCAKPALRLVALVGFGVTLAACSSSSTTSDTERNFTERLLFGNTKLTEQAPISRRDLGCPSVKILSDTGVYRAGDPSGARGVSFQASINDFARECRPDGETLRIKVGVQGRLILGDNGKPGTITVPVRVVVRGNGATLYSKLHPIAVTIPPNDTQSPFMIIDDGIAVPITATDPADQYSILVGLDPQGVRPERQTRR